MKCFITNEKNTVCALRTDIWTSDVQMESYISLTASVISDSWELSSRYLEVKKCPGLHTALNLIGHIETTTNEWNIPIENAAIVRDSGANVKKATAGLNFRLHFDS